MRCQLNDLAVIENATPDNIGLFVDVIEFVGNYKFVSGHSYISWRVKSKHPMTSYNGKKVNIAICPDCILKPIRGPQKEATTSRDKELEKV